MHLSAPWPGPLSCPGMGVVRPSLSPPSLIFYIGDFKGDSSGTGEPVMGVHLVLGWVVSCFHAEKPQIIKEEAPHLSLEYVFIQTCCLGGTNKPRPSGKAQGLTPTPLSPLYPSTSFAIAPELATLLKYWASGRLRRMGSWLQGQGHTAGVPGGPAVGPPCPPSSPEGLTPAFLTCSCL